MTSPYAPAPWSGSSPAPSYVWTPPAHSTGGLHLAVAWCASVFSLGYFLPWAIAATRDRRDTGLVALLNLFLGWTLVGWVVALVLACRSDPAPAVVFVPVPYAVAAEPAPAVPVPAAAHAWSEPTVLLPRAEPEPTLVLPSDPYDPRRTWR